MITRIKIYNFSDNIIPEVGCMPPIFSAETNITCNGIFRNQTARKYLSGPFSEIVGYFYAFRYSLLELNWLV